METQWLDKGFAVSNYSKYRRSCMRVDLLYLRPKRTASGLRRLKAAGQIYASINLVLFQSERLRKLKKTILHEQSRLIRSSGCSAFTTLQMNDFRVSCPNFIG